MDKHFNPTVSIEKVAAFLDGNLPENEMQQISSLIQNDDALKSIYEVSENIDTSLNEYTSNGIQIPDEILNLDFDLPTIDDTYHPSNEFMFDSMSSLEIAACAEKFQSDEDENEHLYQDDYHTDNQDFSNSYNNEDDSTDKDNSQITLDDDI